MRISVWAAVSERRFFLHHQHQPGSSTSNRTPHQLFYTSAVQQMAVDEPNLGRSTLFDGNGVMTFVDDTVYKMRMLIDLY
jgi:hypothetical protein